MPCFSIYGLLALVCCERIGLLYWNVCFLHYQTPVYNITSSVLIKEDNKKGGAATAMGLAAIQDLGMLSMTSKFDNEVEILKSRTLIKKVVSDMGLYINLSEENAWSFNPPLYKNSPVEVFIYAGRGGSLAGTREITYVLCARR